MQEIRNSNPTERVLKTFRLSGKKQRQSPGDTCRETDGKLSYYVHADIELQVTCDACCVHQTHGQVQSTLSQYSILTK